MPNHYLEAALAALVGDPMNAGNLSSLTGLNIAPPDAGVPEEDNQP